MSERIKLLRGLHEARTQGTLEEYIGGLSSEEYELIAANIEGATAHMVSSTLVTSLDHAEILENSAPLANANHFNAYRKWQESIGKLPKKSLDSIEETTQDIIRLVNHKFNQNERCYGLVVGYVQSGKTGHFSGLISRAIDEGFTFVIVLSGILNDLRRQTQIRLHKDVFGSQNIKIPGAIKAITPPANPVFRFLTDVDSDIGSGEYTIIDDDMRKTLSNNEVLIAITKKNTSVLQHLLNGISNCPEKLRKQHKVLIIDDEADHATVNTGGDGENEFADSSLEGDEDEENPLDDDDPSKTNLLVRKIILQFPTSSYIGYTATPYANVLIDPFLETEELGLSLYPRDFIMNLAKPDDYFGAKNFFGTEDNEGHHVSLHPEDTAEEIMEVELTVESNIAEVTPNALKVAIMDFVLTGALKQHRRSRGSSIHPLHHSMLVHVSRLNADQSVIYDMIQQLVERWKTQARSMFECDGFLEMLKKRWQDEFVSKFPKIEAFSEFSELFVEEDGWMQDVKVMMINSESDETLDYDAYNGGLNVIAIGGNKLSRGLTLEGLTVSIYMRKTKMYDSLMQMGRWFGYRQGYSDLVRVHTTEQLYSWFEWLVKAEDAVRNDIDRYAILGVSPTDVAVRIPWHDELIPTARNKMKYAIKNIYNYSNRTTESVHLPIYDEPRLLHNFNAANALFEQLGEKSDNVDRGYEWKHIDKSTVIKFLESINLPGPPTAAFDTKGLVRFIQKTDGLEDFVVMHTGRDWDGVATTQTNSPPTISLPHDLKPRYVGRSQLGIEGKGTSNIRAISDPNDLKRSREIDPSRPALIVYFVAPGSKNARGSVTRMDLPEGPTPIVGITLRFPETEGPLSDVRAALTVRGLKGDINE
jgi:hypothetical protein